MAKKSEESISNQVHSRIAAVRDLIFGENIQQYNTEFSDLYKKIENLQEETRKSLSDSVINLENKLADLESMKFRYYKNFRSRDLDEENLAIIPVDQSSYEIAINETQYENYKNFFTKSYAESIDMLGETLIVKNTYAQPMRFEVTDFGRDPMIEETINMKDMGEVIFLSKVLGDYNITKYGNTIVLTNEGYRLHLKRI